MRAAACSGRSARALRPCWDCCLPARATCRRRRRAVYLPLHPPTGLTIRTGALTGMKQATPNRADELRRETSERNVAAILDATVSQLEHDPNPSLVEIAKAAGVSRPTLYAHFPTREDLV